MSKMCKPKKKNHCTHKGGWYLCKKNAMSNTCKPQKIKIKKAPSHVQNACNEVSR